MKHLRQLVGGSGVNVIFDGAIAGSFESSFTGDFDQEAAESAMFQSSKQNMLNYPLDLFDDYQEEQFWKDS